MPQQWCKHANLIQNPKESTWQWCRDCGAFRERPQAVWNEPSRPRELRTKLAALLAALLKEEDAPVVPASDDFFDKVTKPGARVSWEHLGIRHKGTVKSMSNTSHVIVTEHGSNWVVFWGALRLEREAP